jgi:hypothetical protein
VGPTSTLVRRRRSLLALAFLALALALVLARSGEAAAAPLSIRVDGNRFVNGAGQTVRLLGVNHASFEYACEFGYAYDDGHMDDADAAAIASWNASAVRIPSTRTAGWGSTAAPATNRGRPSR